MSLDALAALVNVGSAGAVIAVVVIFLRFIEKRDNQVADVMSKLVTRIENLESKFDNHDATEMEFLRGVVARLDRKTQPRKQS